MHPKTLVGIDLFACPCIEGGQLTWGRQGLSLNRLNWQ